MASPRERLKTQASITRLCNLWQRIMCLENSQLEYDLALFEMEYLIMGHK